VPLVLGAGAGGFLLVRRARRTVGPASRFHVPETVSPFTVLGLLRAIQADEALASAQRVELEQAIEALERRYFADHEPSATNGEASAELRSLAESWVARTR
jgi:hypothetical protein